LAEKTWTIAAGRMKAGKEHRIPLSKRTLAVLGEMQALRPDADRQDPPDEFVFPGGKAGKPLSNMAFLMLLRRVGRDDLTAHGFRSSFRDWASERTAFPAEVAEMALAHAVSDKTVAAYKRTDLFDKRRRLMDAWAEFCATPKEAARSNVSTLRHTG
jgi:integrase